MQKDPQDKKKIIKEKKGFFSSLSQSLALSQFCITLLRSSHFFCFAASADGTIVSATKNVEQILGCHLEEIIGKNGICFLHKEDVFVGYRFFKKSRKDLSDAHCVVRIKSDKEGWIRIKLFPLWNQTLKQNPHYIGILLT